MTYNTVTIHDETINKSVTIGWDMCGECKLHITRCRCYGGPQVPSYITNWNGAPTSQKAAVSTAKDSYVLPEVRRIERHPVTGRKVRADRGVKRGPQTPGIPATPAAPERPPVMHGKTSLTGPCKLHTAESRLNSDGTYTCSIDGCMGVE